MRRKDQLPCSIVVQAKCLHHNLMRRGRSLALPVLAIACGAVIAGCAAARRPIDIPPDKLRAQPRLAEGQRVFMQFCNQCHVGGAAGLAPSLNDKHLPPFLIRFQVRHGLGSMPSFSDRTLSDSQLDDVVEYLRYLRRHPVDLQG